MHPIPFIWRTWAGDAFSAVITFCRFRHQVRSSVRILFFLFSVNECCLFLFLFFQVNVHAYLCWNMIDACLISIWCISETKSVVLCITNVVKQRVSNLQSSSEDDYLEK